MELDTYFNWYLEASKLYQESNMTSLKNTIIKLRGEQMIKEKQNGIQSLVFIFPFLCFSPSVILLLWAYQNLTLQR